MVYYNTATQTTTSSVPSITYGSSFGSDPNTLGGTTDGIYAAGTQCSTGGEYWLIKSHTMALAQYTTGTTTRPFTGAIWAGSGSAYQKLVASSNTLDLAGVTSAPTTARTFSYAGAVGAQDSQGYVVTGNFYAGWEFTGTATTWTSAWNNVSGTVGARLSYSDNAPSLETNPTNDTRNRRFNGYITYDVVTIPTAPTGLSYTTVAGGGGATVSFTKPTRTGGLQLSDVEYSLNGGVQWTSIGTSSSSFTFTSSSAIQNVLVRFVNYLGSGPSTSINTITVVKPVVSVSASSTGKSVYISYSASQNPDTITITRNGESLGSISGGSFVDVAPAYSTSYTYIISATNIAGTGTGQTTVTTGAEPVLSSNPIWQAPTPSNTSIRLYWTPSTGLNGTISYKVERALDANFTSGLTTVLNWGSGTLSGSYRYVDSTGLSPQTKYYFRIQSRITDGDVTYYSQTTVTTDSTYSSGFSDLFFTTGGRIAYYYNGSWVPAIPQTWSNNIQINAPVYYWNGSTWVLNTL